MYKNFKSQAKINLQDEKWKFRQLNNFIRQSNREKTNSQSSCKLNRASIRLANVINCYTAKLIHCEVTDFFRAP